MSGNTVDRMVEGISESAIVLVHMSKEYELSANCQKELDFAVSELKQMIPIRLDHGPFPKTKFKTESDNVLYFDFCVARLQWNQIKRSCMEEYLWSLQKNQLRGGIPKSLGNLANLTGL
ncbi:hypothetical protein HK100_000134 [Physocladia obscura]|uniref:TIR domain-containing protein n=1 Tax=Physocladia obscura TaxID=109957 RepID=A0AAD5XHL0_9FUNG|nr:hypothetical protein HK100_000134 [Physocladia obscura]